MKILTQFFWILLFSILGEIVALLIAPIFPVPGSVVGIILLFIALHWKLLDISKVRETGRYLAANMGIMFVPAGVGVIAYFDILQDTWLQLTIITLVSTIFYIVFVGKLVAWMNKSQQKRKNKGGEHTNAK